MAEPDPGLVAAQRARARAALEHVSPRRGSLDRLVSLVVRAGFTMVGWRIRVIGRDRLPRDQAGRIVPCVIAVAPHRGWIDPFLLLLAWPTDAPRLAWFGDARTMARSRWRRALLPRLGMIPIPSVPSPGSVREHLADARTALGRGCCLVVFPEKGPPSPAGQLRTVAHGAAWLAGAGGVPLVPVAIGGFLQAGLGTRFGLVVLTPLPAPPPPSSAAGLRAAHDTTELLRARLAHAVAKLEAWSVRVNHARPLPALGRLFR